MSRVKGCSRLSHALMMVVVMIHSSGRVNEAKISSPISKNCLYSRDDMFGLASRQANSLGARLT